MRMNRTIALLTAGLWAACVFAQRPAPPTFSTENIDKAVEKAKNHILKLQKPNGSWAGIIGHKSHPHLTDIYPSGNTALALIALHDCGMSVRNPAWRKGAAYLMKQDDRGVYGRVLKIIALSIGARIDRARYLPELQRDVRVLLKGMRPNGGWRYRLDYHKLKDDHAHSTDNSCSQYVALALREASYAGVEVPRKVWKYIEKYWRAKQCKDGGWDYADQPAAAKDKLTPGRAKGYGSMSAAGLASCYIVFDMLLAKRRGSRPICKPVVYKPIKPALRWFDKNFSAGQNPGRGGRHYYYYLYNVERIGATSGRKYFGKHDWYKGIATNLLRRQNAAGKWGREFHEHCYATIFMAKARAQVLINKLEYHDLDWDVHSRDIANLARNMSERFERPLNWQIVDMKRDVRELQDAPILFVTGSKPLKFDDEDVAKFRRYILEGGTLLGQAACNSKAFAKSFRDLCAAALPEYEMRTLTPEHPVFSAHAKLRATTLMGIDNGVRTCVFLMPKDISFYWHRRMTSTHKADFQLGGNLVIYAMDRAGFRSKSLIPPIRRVEPTRQITAAMVRHPAGWNANPIMLERLSEMSAQHAKLGLDVKKPVELGKSDLAGIRLLWMSGHRKLELPDAAKTALKGFLTGGGTLVVDAANGNEEFFASVVVMLEKLLPDAKVKTAAAQDPVVSGKLASVGFDVSRPEYRRALRIEGYRGRTPQWYLYQLDGRTAVIASPHDIASGIQGQNPWNCRGYAIPSAGQIGVNLALLAAGKGP